MYFVLVLAIFAIFLWLFGYFITARTMSVSSGSSEYHAKIVAPPKWLYYLCGAPGNNDYPRGTMRVGALAIQVWGIALMTFVLCFYIFKFSRLEFVFGLLLAFIIPLALGAYIGRKYSVGDAIKEPIVIQKGSPVTPTRINDDLSYSIEGNCIDLYSIFGSSGGATLTIDIEELDVLIETLQGIQAFMQTEQSKKSGGSWNDPTNTPKR